ncbi:hypothetical protein JCM24511_01508 [Saitozyma sp. JCM 24511]|nr:hypothetical protein JCM24511_01508 [Saitozyma sp. JCM 24511]
MPKSILRWPNTIRRHVQTCSHWFSPVGSLEGRSPVVRDPHHLPILELANRNIAEELAVSIVDSPLDDYQVSKREPTTHFKGYRLKIAFDRRNKVGTFNELPHLRPLPDNVLGQRDSKEIRQTSLTAHCAVGV